jgi:hypothetical protein
MTIRRSRFAIVKIAGLGVSIFVALAAVYSAGKSAAQAVSNAPSAKSSAATTATDKTAPAAGPATDSAGAADQNHSATHAPQLVAAGTATYVRPANQDNKRAVRVKLPAEIAAHLADDYIVLLTNRFPTGGYPFLSAYWRPATDGFDILLVDVELGQDTTASYVNPNTKYLVDWLVVKK